VIEKLAPMYKLGSWLEARKGQKVVIKMRLIEISTSKSDVRPFVLLAASDHVQYLLKTADATK
jgi:hypothetical protein